MASNLTEEPAVEAEVPPASGREQTPKTSVVEQTHGGSSEAMEAEAANGLKPFTLEKIDTSNVENVTVEDGLKARGSVGDEIHAEDAEIEGIRGKNGSPSECREPCSEPLNSEEFHDTNQEIISAEDHLKTLSFAENQVPDNKLDAISIENEPENVRELEPDIDAMASVASPSSNGYAGSSSTKSDGSFSGIEEIDRGGTEPDNGVDEFSESASWVAGKRHLNEDDASISWRKRKKHFFVLSHSGKPIYSRYGDEHKLAGFSATLQAIISFVENGGDRVKLVRAGKHQVIFVVKGPIYLVCISCTEEPYVALRGQLELIYGQMLLILTKAVNRCFEKNPKFDMTPLLGGTEAVFSSLIHAFSWNPATFLHAYTCLPLSYSTRQATGAILQDVADSGVLFAILMCKHKVISLVGAQKASLHPDDMLLLSNFVLSSESFRTSESFSPICLPRYNPMAFLYAYVHYLDVEMYLILLTTNSDAFYHLKDCRIQIEMVLLKSNVLSEVQRSMLDGGLHVEDLPVDPSHPTLRSGSGSPHLGMQDHVIAGSPRQENAGIGGPAGLWHFIYRSIYLDQYVASEFSSPINSCKQQKRLYRAYQRLYASMHDKEAGPHKTQFRKDEDYVLLCWITQDFELYAAFDPLAEKGLAINVCNRVCQWVRDLENEIFLLGASPFSW
ncbi:vacuolar fusion protein MON1 homolog isoform X1 [Amborella trichopoda]|uniref:vacuolar fusion protein MON1 homolog isoform X1 n=2 Tax=Amborella trichopoda TaxID=13333 RepID=UPI0005D3B4FB|nr:vacuolar fusion protein MON1 homolog isoform X1 [Amborella trichopoda]|eukprot:XP_011623342.1 vacuolar fusion protein MON1 homolog isoform X1 [Amborella trichopoda]